MGDRVSKRVMEERNLVCILNPPEKLRTYHRNRNDAKTVSIVALGCFHPVTKVQSASVHFFLGSEDDAADSDDEIDEPDVKGLRHKRTVGKKTKSMEKRLEKTVKLARKVRLSVGNR